MQRSRSLHTEAWRIYAIALLNVLVSSNYLVHSCDESGLECGITVIPTNRTNIVDLSSSGCNDTHIWISWNRTTPEDCTVKRVAITGKYTCFMEDGTELLQRYRSPYWSSSTTEWSHEHNAWNTSAKSVAECNITGFYEFSFEMDRYRCRQGLLPANIVCSNQVQPSYLPAMMTSSSPIAMTITYTSMLHTLSVQPTPTITPQLNASFQILSEIQIVVIITTCSIVALLLLTSFIAVMLMRWKNQKPTINYNYYNYDKDLLDFKPGFTPVIPGEMVFKEDAISIQSTITPLEKIESGFVLNDISIRQIPASQTHKLSQPKDYRQLG